MYFIHTWLYMYNVAVYSTGHQNLMIDVIKSRVYSGTSLVWSPLGQPKVSRLVRCPHFRGSFMHINFTIIYLGPTAVSRLKRCAYFRGVLKRGFRNTHDTVLHCQWLLNNNMLLYRSVPTCFLPVVGSPSLKSLQSLFLVSFFFFFLPFHQLVLCT